MPGHAETKIEKLKRFDVGAIMGHDIPQFRIQSRARVRERELPLEPLHRLVRNS
ncbi:MAG TPA: hypothetical protein VF751_03230 [Chthoniobacterales bacterium]